MIDWIDRLEIDIWIGEPWTRKRTYSRWTVHRGELVEADSPGRPWLCRNYFPQISNWRRRAENSDDNNQIPDKYRAEHRSKNGFSIVDMQCETAIALSLLSNRWSDLVRVIDVTYRSSMGKDVLKIVEHDVVAMIQGDIEAEIIDQFPFFRIASLIQKNQ